MTREEIKAEKNGRDEKRCTEQECAMREKMAEDSKYALDGYTDANADDIDKAKAY